TDRLDLRLGFLRSSTQKTQQQSIRYPPPHRHFRTFFSNSMHHQPKKPSNNPSVTHLHRSPIRFHASSTQKNQQQSIRYPPPHRHFRTFFSKGVAQKPQVCVMLASVDETTNRIGNKEVMPMIDSSKRMGHLIGKCRLRAGADY
ncbi:MAG: hypothetical protein VKK42_07700, partial [Lyngbya sp.]|nr:hypothetical protein [Lyngbya sp.]